MFIIYVDINIYIYILYIIDYCVVRGGAAGLSAALETSDKCKGRVILLESMSRVGGNSAKASSGFVILL